MNQEMVDLVNENGQSIGAMEKMEVHVKGLLHRGVSVFVFNLQGEYFLQKRAYSKYHSPGLWSNTCCTHPRPGEDVQEAASRRLFLEMGLSCRLYHCFDLVYRAVIDNAMVEHEYDHIFLGVTDAMPFPNSEEVDSWYLLSEESVTKWLAHEPHKFTAWFPLLFEKLKTNL